MPTNCVAGCSSIAVRETAQIISFHRFPDRDREPARHAAWVRGVKRTRKYLVRQLSPLFYSNLELEYIVFSLQNIVVQTPHLKNPEGVEVSPLGNFSYSHFFQNGHQ